MLRIHSLLLALLSSLHPTVTSAQPATEPQGRMHAILIGVDDYYRSTSLNYAGADVRLLKETLQTHCRCDSVYVMTQQGSPRDQPDFAKVLGALRDELHLANNGNYDSLLIFFAGHGLNHLDDGSLFLAPGDFIPGLEKQTCIPIALVRELLAHCDHIERKILILDSCHAGSKTDDREELRSQPTGGEIARQLGNPGGLITFASCRSEQSSIEWPQRRHGLVTFWMCVGLSGWADQETDGRRDGQIQVGELHQFVSKMVASTLDLFALRKGVRHPQQPDLIAPTSEHQTVIASVDHDSDSQAITSSLAKASRLIKLLRPEDAIVELENAMKLKPWDPEICAWKAKAHLHFYEKSKRSEHLATALADLDTAILLTEYLIKNRGRRDLSSDLRQYQIRREGLIAEYPEVAR